MAIKPRPPAQPQPSPYAPAGQHAPLTLEDVTGGANTSTTRAGVADNQAYWIDGFIPLGPRQLRTLYDVGTALYQIAAPVSINLFGFYNLGATAYAFVVLSDGSAVQVEIDTGTVTGILAPGTINNPTQEHVGFCQSGQKYLLIVTDNPSFNGYWIWDGSLLYQAGTFSPFVTLTNPGSGYQTVPAVVATGGSGTGAAFSATIANGVVTNVIVTSAGSGYLPGDVVQLVFHGGNVSGTGASLTADPLAGPFQGVGATVAITLGPVGPNGALGVASALVTGGGSGYTQFTVITVTPTSGTMVNPPLLSANIIGGVIQTVTINNVGFFLAGSTAVATVSDSGVYKLTSVTISNAGSGYSPSAAATTAGTNQIVAATLKLTLSSGHISAVQVINGGAYSSNSVPMITVTDTLTNAAATATLMPFGISGTTIETFSGRAWIGLNAVYSFSAPGSLVDFSTSSGGGQIQSADSFLRVKYTRFVQSNGFLYLIADSSINYISGVQTSGNPPTTTFTNQNADPEVGTAWPYAVAPVGRNIVFGNSYGVHQLLGAEAKKISEPMDGVYNSVGNQTNGFAFNLTPSAARAIVFGKKIWMLLLPIIDPITNALGNKLLINDGKKWFASTQAVNITFIQTQEINSILTAWGTDGHNLFPMFKFPSPNFTKRAQTKLWDAPGGTPVGKTDTRLWGAVQNYTTSAATINITADTEVNSTAPLPMPVGAAPPSQSRLSVFPPQSVGQQGVFNGMTISTTAADVAIVTITLDAEIGNYRG